jgi:hypothetical protein
MRTGTSPAVTLRLEPAAQCLEEPMSAMDVPIDRRQAAASPAAAAKSRARAVPIFFLLPTSLVSAELASGWDGGAYQWVSLDLSRPKSAKAAG